MLVTGCASPSTVSGSGGSRLPGTPRHLHHKASSPRLTAVVSSSKLQQQSSPRLLTKQASSPRLTTVAAAEKSSPAPSSKKQPVTTTTSSPASTHYNNNNNMGFLKAPHHYKVPSAPAHQQHHESSFSDKFSTMLDHCQKKIKLLQGPSSLFTTLVTKARRKERESPAAEQEHKLYLEEAVLERKIPETDLRQLVELPPGLGYHEWLASHTIDFFQHINLVYGTIAEFCTMSGCSDMSGPATRPYLWFDEKGKKVRVAAPQYIDYVMTFTQKTINDETIFPTKFENDFPVSFESIVKKIHRLLFHVIAHLYHSHFRELVLLSLHAHLNCIFAHFTLFNERFRLIDEKETEILHDLVLALRLHPEDRERRAAAEQQALLAAAAAGEDCDDAPSNSSNSVGGVMEEGGVRHCSNESAAGRASPAAGNTATDAAVNADDNPQCAQTGIDQQPLASSYSTASPITADVVKTTAPFISPDLTDTRP